MFALFVVLCCVVQWCGVVRAVVCSIEGAYDTISSGIDLRNSSEFSSENLPTD